MFRLKLLKSWLVVLPILAVIGCGVPESSIEVKTAREAAAANCEQSGKCVKDPSGLVLYNSDLVTENFILKTPSQSQTLLTRLINLVDEPKLLVMSGKLDPLIRGVRIVSESEICDSPKGIDGINPTISQLRSFKQGRYKACISYIGDGLFKRVHTLPPIEVDTTAPEVTKDEMTKSVLTAASVSLSWSKSSDNLTPESKLVYSVYVSKTNALDSIDNVVKYGSLVPGVLVGGTSYIVNSLAEDTDYNVAVTVSDEAGNRSLVGHSRFKTLPLDATVPTVTISSDRDPGPTNLTSVLLTIQFSEPVNGFTAAGINVNGATKGQFTAIDSDTYTLALSTTSPTVSAVVPAGSAKDVAGNNSLVSNTWTLAINGAAAAPVASPLPGVYTSAQSVELSSQTPGATIYYTLDNSTPTVGSLVYSAPIFVGVTTTIKALATAPMHNNSAVVNLPFTITGKVQAPSFSVASGSYGPAQTVEISTATPGATIYYTDDNSPPNRGSFRYSAPIAVSTSKKITAFAVLDGWDDSESSSETYTINGSVAAPEASPVAGTYTTAQSVTLSTATQDATIYYTLDGSAPTTESTLYTAPIFVQVSQTIRAIAVKSSFIDSITAEFPYVITGKVQAPSFSVAGGSYGPTQTVAISTATPGATIYYTDDGSMPTKDSSMYTSPITVSVSKTIRAFAVLDEYADSESSTETYTINGSVAAPEASPVAGTYTTAQSVTLSTATQDATIYYTLDGSAPTTESTLYTAPIFVQVSQTIRAIAVKSSFIDSITAEFPYVITGKVQAPIFSVSTGSYGPAQTIEITSLTPGTTIYYTSDGSTPTRESARYTSPLVVSTSQIITAFAVLSDWDDSELSSASYTINGFVDPPSALTQPGIYTSPIEVELSASVSGASIFYTVDGSTPNSFSLLYSAPIFVQVSQTIKAIAVKPNYIDSVPVEFSYTINGTVQKPEFSLPGGSYGPAQSVSMMTPTPNATIYFTTDGSEPTRSSTRYVGAVNVTEPTTIKAFAVFADWADSAVETAQYTINGSVANPVGDPAPDTYNSIQSVRLLTIPADAQIYYTIDGSDPATSSTRLLYSDALTLNSSTNIKAVASRADFIDSEAVSLQYNIIPAISFSQSSYTLTAGVSNASITPFRTDLPIDSCSIEPTLPAGLNFNTSDCSITGTPSYGGPAVSYTITPMNASGVGRSSLITILVNGNDSMGAYYFNGQLANGLVDDGTVLLLHMDSNLGSTSFVDNSLSRKTATVFGDARIDTNQSRFGNASAYFDGWEDRIFFPSDSDFNFGQGDFTVEFWFYPASSDWYWNESAMVSTADPQDQYGVLAGGLNGRPEFLAGDGSWKFRMDPFGVGIYQWHHMAITRSEGVASIFVNGTLVQTTPDTSNLINPNNGITIGGRTVANQYFQGYIDEVRVTKGYSRYKDSFTPPNVAFNDSACYTAGYARACTRTDYNCPDTGYCSALAMYFVNGVEHPGLNSSGTGISTEYKQYVNGSLANGLVGVSDPHSDKIVLLMHMDGSNGSTGFTDSSTSNLSITPNGNVTISTAESKFGGASAYFDGDSDYLRTNYSMDWNSDFTLEFWYRRSGPGSGVAPTLFEAGNLQGGVGGVHVYLYDNYLKNSNGISEGITSLNTAPQNEWSHVALVRNSGTNQMFLNGVSQGTSQLSFPVTNDVLTVGSAPNYGFHFNGNIDELRITKDVARYTSNFTPPTEPFGSACFTAGVQRACTLTDYNCASTGYCAGLGKYFVSGVEHRGLNSAGTGISTVDNNYYVNGSLAEGVAPDHGIVLLLHMDGYHGSREFADSSQSAKSATVYGDTYIHSNSKFGSGSAYFDGWSDYLSYSSPSDFKLGTGDFTAELWFKPDEPYWCGWWCVTSDRPLLTTADPSDTDGFLMMTSNYYSNTLSYLAGSNSNWWPINRTYSNVNSGTWNHYAVSRQSGTTRVFLNGSLVDSFGDSVDYTNVNQAIRVGGRSIGGQGFHGYIDEVRVTKGKARYTTSFSADNLAYNDNACYSAGAERACGPVDYGCPVTGYCSALAMYYVDGVGHPGLSSSGTGVSAVDNKYYVDGVPANGLVSDLSTSLLLHMDGVNGSAAFIDSSALGAVVTPTGSAVIDGVRKKVGTGSVYFNGSSDLSISHSSGQLNFGSGDFTIHGWINPESLAGDDFLISGSDSGDFFFGIYYGQLGIGRRLVAWDSVVPASIPTGVWTHVAVTRQAGVVSFYVNGELIGQRSNNTSYGINSPSVYVGSHGGVFYWRGNIDELQVTKGLSRYVSNFLPPMRAIGSTCYGGGYARACTLNDYGCSATGYCSMLSVYVIDGVEHPGLNSNGTGISTVDYKYYVNGALANGRVGDTNSDGTVLLLHMDGTDGSTTFTDSSPSNITISPTGNSALSATQSKFGGTSAYFDGNSFLSSQVQSAFDFGTDNFSVEAWIYPTSFGWHQRIAGIGNGAMGGSVYSGWVLSLQNAGQLWFYRYDGNQNYVESTGAVSLNQWNHVAVTRENGLLTFWINGVAAGSFAFPYSLSRVNEDPFGIGYWYSGHGNTYFNGYIDELRISKGIARYTSNFTPPTEPFGTSCYTDGDQRACTYVDYACSATGYCSGMAKYVINGVPHPGLNSSGTGVSTDNDKYYVNGNLANGLVSDPHSDKTVLLMHMDGADGSTSFVDSSQSAHTVSASGSSVISTAQSKFGGSSGWFDGSFNSLVSVPYHSDFELGANDFTVELWFHPTDVSSGYLGVFAQEDFNFLSLQLNEDCAGAPGTLNTWIDSDGSGGWDFGGGCGRVSNTTFEVSQWYHLAVARSGGNISLYVNGNLDWTEPFSGSIYTNPNSPIYFGRSQIGDRLFRGYIDEVRITKGLARYTSNFTPSTEPFGTSCYTDGEPRACTAADY